MDSPPTAPSSEEPEPTVVDGRYRLDGVLGRGGMATVHRAHDVLLERDVALKVFPAVHGEDEQLMRNRAEVRVLAALSHPALVMLYDAGAEQQPDGGQQDYLVMELVGGPTLSERLRRAPLDRAQTARVGRDLAEALAVVHAQDVIHRDIKPGNILLTGPDALDADDGGPAVKLADFGIARLIDGTRLTMTGQTLGTVLYLSPEQARGEALAPSSDIYSLGLVLIECLTGRPAFAGTTAESAIARLVSPPHVPEDIDADLAALLTRMTLMVPDERPSADEVAAALAALAEPDRTLALPAAATPLTEVQPTEAVPAPPAPERSRRRHPRRALLAAGTALALAAGGLLVAQRVSADPPADAPSYPAVEGRLGKALTELQESVQP